MNLVIIRKAEETNLDNFINFWSKLYPYPFEKLYNHIITKHQYDLEDIQNLFLWKNGMKLSGNKQYSFDAKIKTKIALINKMKIQDAFSLDDFLLEFNNLTPVWKIFLLHCIKPTIYPIYDQHVHRAYNFIHGFDYKHVSAFTTSREKELFYFDVYLPFVRSLGGIKLKKFDEAFFTFGQFLVTNKYARLIEDV